MELQRRYQEEEARCQIVQREVAHRGQIITSLQASLKGQVEKNEALEKKVTFLEALGQEKSLEVMRVKTLVHEQNLKLEELSSKAKQREDENSNLRRSLSEITCKFGGGLGEQEMSEMAKREGCKHFLKSEDGQGLVLRLVKSSCKDALIDAQGAVQEKYPEYSLPESFQEIIGDGACSLVMPWEDGFPFEEMARPYDPPPQATEGADGEESDRAEGNVPPAPAE